MLAMQADAVVGAIKQYAAQAELDLRATTEFEEVVDQLSGLMEAVAAAYRLDKKDAERRRLHFLQAKLSGTIVEQMFKPFFDSGAMIKAACDKALREIAEAINQLGDKAAHVPAALERDAATWESASSTIGGFTVEINGVSKLEGWTGKSAESYGNASKVQAGASTELSGVASAVANALGAIACFNRAIFLECKQAIRRATVDIITTATGGGGLYSRTVKATKILARLLDEIAKATNNPDLAAASDELQSQIAATRNSPALLTPEGWPSGGSQHGVNPSQTNNVPGGGGGGAPR